jgi:hypothetical protein
MEQFPPSLVGLASRNSESVVKAVNIHAWFVARQHFNASWDHYAAPGRQKIKHMVNGNT